MNEQQQLMALMVLAEKQQAAVQAAIEGLKEQQKALIIKNFSKNSIQCLEKTDF